MTSSEASEESPRRIRASLIGYIELGKHKNVFPHFVLRSPFPTSSRPVSPSHNQSPCIFRILKLYWSARWLFPMSSPLLIPPTPSLYPHLLLFTLLHHICPQTCTFTHFLLCAHSLIGANILCSQQSPSWPLCTRPHSHLLMKERRSSDHTVLLLHH